MPYRMHSEYLHSLFLNNDLAAGRYQVDGRPVAISHIHAPIFAVGTVKDHVAPWRSVFKINLLANSQAVTFVLTSGGHNAGIVSEPGHPRRAFQIASRRDGEAYVDADTWECNTPRREGSWWPAWEEWLSANSSGLREPPAMGASAAGCAPSNDAPGTYIFQT
jgi:polyhydroxyalkanoate synthase